MRNNEERFGANMTRQDPVVPQQLTQDGAAQPQLNFIVPTELVMLPSRGKFYPPHHPLHNKDAIEIKQMTAKEEDILTSKSLIKKGVALDKLIQSLVVNKSINTDTLTLEDRTAILISARISAYGNDYETLVTCPSCTEKTKYKFDLMEHVDKNEADTSSVILNPDGTFEFDLPTTKWHVKCRALNGYDEKVLIKVGDNNNLQNDSMLLQQLKSTVIEVQTVCDQKLVHAALEVLPAKDSRFIRSMYQKVVVPYDLSKTFVCNKCDYSTILEVSLSADFFWFK